MGLDSSVLICFVEENPTHIANLDRLFGAIADGRLEAACSAMTLMECLVAPYRSANTALAEQYEAILTGSRGLRLVHVDLDLLRAAAQIRAATRVKTPDALHLASALRAGCTAFVTHDRRLPSIPGLRILQLGDYASPGGGLHEKRRRYATKAPPGKNPRR